MCFYFPSLLHFPSIPLSSPSLPYPSPSLPFPSPVLPSPSPLLSLSFPSPPSLRSSPLKPASGSGERCKLPQRGPGQSSGQKRIWCTLELSESMVAIILSIRWSEKTRLDLKLRGCSDTPITPPPAYAPAPVRVNPSVFQKYV